MEPVNKESLHEILAEFMDGIEQWESNIEGSPEEKDLKDLEHIYDETIDQLDKEYFKSAPN